MVICFHLLCQLSYIFVTYLGIATLTLLLLFDNVLADGGDQKLQSESTESNDTMVGPETRRNTSDTGSPLAPVPLQTPGPNTPICRLSSQV